jgi:Helix-turn-helix domain
MDRLPPEVSDRADFMAACSDRDLGEVFRLARKWGGWTNTRLGRACGLSPSRVGEYMKGDLEARSAEVLGRVADGLGIPGALLGLNRRTWEVRNAGVLVVPSSDAPWQSVAMRNRLGASDVSAEALDTIALETDQLAREYAHADALNLHAQVTGWMDHTARLLEGRTTLRQHKELLVRSGWLFLLSGCIEYDLGWRRRAEASRQAALSLAKESGDGHAAAWAHEMAAWFALTQGRLHDVIDACEAGRAEDSTHSVGAQLHAQEAKARARMGDRRAVLVALEEGRNLLDSLPLNPDTKNHFVVDPAKQDFYSMDSFRMLRDDANATVHAREVMRLSRRPDGSELSPMRVAEARLTLGVAASRAGELEEAVARGIEALDTPRQSLPSLLMVARELSAEISVRYPREAPAREYREKLVELIRAAPPAPELPS